MGAAKSRATFALIVGVTAAFLLSPPSHAADVPQTGGAPHDSAYDLNHINPDFLLAPTEAYNWHAAKDALGPAFAGNASWQVFMTVVEAKLREYGAVDITRNAWTYDRWHTTEWPDDSNWSLVSDGDPVHVASYGAYSGSTGGDGVTAELIFYDATAPPASIEGKIAVFQTVREDPLNPPENTVYAYPGDYEYLSDPQTFRDPRRPRLESNSVSVFPELRQVRQFIEVLREGRAAGGIFVIDASYKRLAGLYTFGVPALYDAPSLYLGREAGRKVIADAKAGKQATLKLKATVEPTETYQLISYLPGKNYGAPEDEQILLITHTDGPSISQDDGAYGILGIVHYFSHIPQSQRPRTLLLFMDNRHYMPGMERAFAKENWFEKHPETLDQVVAVVGIEHLGQLEFAEIGEDFAPTGLVEQSRLHCTNNQALVDLAIKAVKDNGLKRVAVHCVDRPGIHGAAQGRWFGLGGIARRRGLPGYATMGSMAAYWTTSARIHHFNAEHFVDQVATMAQLTGELMKADLGEIATTGAATE